MTDFDEDGNQVIDFREFVTLLEDQKKNGMSSNHFYNIF